MTRRNLEILVLLILSADIIREITASNDTQQIVNPIVPTSSNIYSIIDGKLENYDKRIRPNLDSDLPVDVGVSLHIISISDLSDSDLEFTVDFYFRQFWRDERLSYESSNNSKDVNFGDEFAQNIWIPDTFFVQDKESFIHKTTLRNSFLKISPQGDVSKSIRLSVTFSCAMQFSKFPFDTQECPINMESYGHDANGIKYHWKNANDAVTIADDHLTAFKLNGFELGEDTIALKSANYSRLTLELEFKRLPGFYCSQVFTPCFMLVILSYISFYVKTANVRLGLCVLSMFLLTIGCHNVSEIIPKTSYTKSIDIFTGTCMAFVFTALIVFAFVSNCQSEKNEKCKVDCLMKIVYPISFMSFLCLYYVFLC